MSATLEKIQNQTYTANIQEMTNNLTSMEDHWTLYMLRAKFFVKGYCFMRMI